MMGRGDAPLDPAPLRTRSRSTRARGVRVFGLVTVLSLFATQHVDAAGLTSPEPLIKAYELILDARFEDAHKQLQQACPPAPRPACEVLDAVADYWEILLDQENTGRDARLIAKIDRSVTTTEDWVTREPKRAEAWFYNGGSRGTRVLMRGLRGQYLAAARDGKRIHDSLRQAVSLEPTLSDAYFGLGLYHYYAAIAPTAARVLRVLLLLPAGDRAGGLKEMEQTRTQGMLLRGEADYQLHLIYLWYERQATRSLGLVEGLRNRYPHNPIFYLRLASVQGDYMRNHQAALQTHRSLYDAARAGRVAMPALSQVNAMLGMAQEMDALCDSEHAVEQLRALIAQRPTAPYAALTRAHYQLGLVYDRIGRRSEALAAYQSAIAANPSDDRLELNAKLRALLKRPSIARVCR